MRIFINIIIKGKEIRLWNTAINFKKIHLKLK
jgi:hypothetical protein